MPERVVFSVATQEEYIALRGKLRKYTGIHYRKTFFELKDQLGIYGLKEAVEALNRKKRSERITYIFDTACRLIDEYNRKNGIKCRFIEGKCQDCRHNRHINGCCYHCGLQTDHGCPTSNLSCKLYFCNYMKEHYKVLTMEEMDILRLLSRSQRNIIRENVFAGRKTSIVLLCIGSYLVFGLYSVYKILTMKNIIVLR